MRQKTDLYIDREKLKRGDKFRTCEGDSIFLVGGWREINEEVVTKKNPLFEFGEPFDDGESDLQDTKRILRYFILEGHKWPLTEFGIFGTDYGVQIISFEKRISRHVFGRKLRDKKEIHFINGYCMSPGMEWMLIEIDAENKRLKVYECDPDCIW